MINYDACFIIPDVFWILKFNDGELNWIEEDLLNFNDWSFFIDTDVYLPQI